ncbi:uncharacterized protein KY384_002957 [Bacidia gigantensis]|uniref:uncharacterized protein n=1 Tax=Bacidia gigantensis TaxID=2732470 RepID=UPI001D04A925|nr:uncharacterized protein KY384_002957 [Bacidia gigantensis]KAG8531328.1 hypothetical protein KY384_002957 [Bacidia gigantensis]
MDITINAHGALSKLSTEIRALIYQIVISQGYILCNRTGIPWTSRKRATLGVLTTNKAIRAEVKDVLYTHGQSLVETRFKTIAANPDNLQTCRGAEGINTTLSIIIDGTKRHDRVRNPFPDFIEPDRRWMACMPKAIGLYKNLQNLHIELETINSQPFTRLG